MKNLLMTLLFATVTTGCAKGLGNPVAPSTPPAPTVSLASLPIVLSGQSNALPDHLGGELASRYTPGVAVVAKGATGIRAWDSGGELWPLLDAQLHQPLRAFIWWQGETDSAQGSLTYAADLRNLMTRVRAANGNPNLPIIVVQIIPYNPPYGLSTDAIRQVEAAYVRSDPHSVLVNVDDLPNDGGNHITAYGPAADRVIAALR